MLFIIMLMLYLDKFFDIGTVLAITSAAEWIRSDANEIQNGPSRRGRGFLSSRPPGGL
jgi:hypothetical protein